MDAFKAVNNDDILEYTPEVIEQLYLTPFKLKKCGAEQVKQLKQK